MLNREQVDYLNSWHNYFLDIEEQGGGSPPSYNADDITFWQKFYRAINKEAKKSNEPVKIKSESPVPFATVQQPINVIPKKQQKQVVTNIQQEEEEY